MWCQLRWRITKSHCMNIGHGEDANGNLVHHPGVWFSGNLFSQEKPDEVFVRNKNVMTANEWEKERTSSAGRKPKQKQEHLTPLSFLKQKDLHELGKLME